MLEVISLKLWLKLFNSKKRYYKNVEKFSVIKSSKNYKDNANSFIEFPCYKEDILNNCDKSFLEKKYEKDELLAKHYDLVQVAGEGNTFSKAENIMNWLTNNTMYCGWQVAPMVDDTDTILQFALKNDFKHAINCRYKAILLSDMLISIGITAMPLVLLGSFEHRGDKCLDCHFVVHVYLEDESKWVVFDPSFNTCFTDDNNQLLDIIQLRSVFAQGQSPIVKGYNFNGDTKSCMEVYKKYFIKGCLEYILTWRNNIRHIPVNQKINGISFNYVLEPDGQDLKAYWRECDDSKETKERLSKFIYIGSNQLLSVK